MAFIIHISCTFQIEVLLQFWPLTCNIESQRSRSRLRSTLIITCLYFDLYFSRIWKITPCSGSRIRSMPNNLILGHYENKWQNEVKFWSCVMCTFFPGAAIILPRLLDNNGSHFWHAAARLYDAGLLYSWITCSNPRVIQLAKLDSSFNSMGLFHREFVLYDFSLFVCIKCQLFLATCSAWSECKSKLFLLVYWGPNSF